MVKLVKMANMTKHAKTAKMVKNANFTKNAKKA